MNTEHPDSSEPDDDPTGEHERRRAEERREDPDAPGNFVDDQDEDDIPEPNEPA